MNTNNSPLANSTWGDEEIRAIECRPIVSGNVTRHPAVKYMGKEISIPDSLTVADEVHFHGLFVGIHHFDLSNQLKFLTDTIKDYFQ